jgi:hypothetical protein
MANDVRTWRFNYGVDTGTGLLDYEYSGLAVNFADTTYFNSSTWAMDDVIERNSNTYDLQSPHVFFTQSGTSPKYVRNSSTTIGWSPHNLCLQSEDLATTWINTNTTETTNSDTAPDGTSTADTLTASSTSACRIGQTVSGMVDDVSHTFSVYLKAGTSSWAALANAYVADGTNTAAWFDLSNGVTGTVQANVTATITSVGSGWYRCSIAGTNTSSASKVVEIYVVDGDNSSAVTNGRTIKVWGAQVERGSGAPTAYISTTTAARIGLPISYGEGLLAEPAATNVIQQSQTMATTWTAGDVTVATNDAVAPDGSTTAEKLTDNADNNEHSIFQQVAGAAFDNVQGTISVYAKAGTLNYLDLSFSAQSAEWIAATYDLSNGTVTASAAGASSGTVTSTSITSVGNGWYRCVLTGTVNNSVAQNPFFVIGMSDSGTPGTRGTGGGPRYSGSGGTIYVWGAQQELGNVATSYIPTVAASATRARDNISVATSAFGFSNTTLTLNAWFTAAETAVHGLTPIEIDDGDDNERILLNGVGMIVVNGGVNQASLQTGSYSGGVQTKIAGACAANDFRAYQDSSALTPDVSGTMPTVTTVRLGSASSGSTSLGYIARVIYLPRAISNAELDTRTS